jgi:hypothetical protein
MQALLLMRHEARRRWVMHLSAASAHRMTGRCPPRHMDTAPHVL